ncbi:ABC transporter permease subunit [Treponema sp. OMZ 840]|uniref:ABC transporter permease subunit n=1 Tax=Treponema sp. OMZ 840 TaxID=244313 RepID=UPI003D8D669E
MRFLRFLVREFIIHGIVFAVAGTLILSAFYLLSIGAPVESYAEAARSFFLLITGSEDFSIAHPGFSSGQIIASAAAVSLPLTLLSLFILTVIALSASAYAVTGRYLTEHHKNRKAERFGGFLSSVLSVFAAVPLFVGFWVLANIFGSDAPFIVIALITVVLGGLSWDATNFLKADMLNQVHTTHAVVFSTLGHGLGRFFPLPETYSGYLFSSSLPRFIPYLAGKVPAIIGSVTIAEIVFSFPGLGSTLLDALLATNTDLLVASVFILLCVNAVVAFLVKTVLFLIYPRWYEKAI